MKEMGKITLRLDPVPGNPRNSEGAFYTLDDGTLLYVYSRFVGESGSDDGHSCIACRTSRDGGESWSGDRVLFTTEEHQAKNIMSVSLLAMRDGAVGLFYVVRYGWHDTRLHLRRSHDRGASWSEAAPCIPCPGYFVTNNDRVIRLSSGRILVPANLHRMKGFHHTDWQSFDGRGIPCMFYSDDDGVTWQESPGYCIVTLPRSRSGLQESGVAELKNGAVWQWMRTDAGCQYEAFSADRGETWSPPTPSRFTSPCSPMSVRRTPGGKLLAVWNPVPNYNGRSDRMYGGRTPLVMATSADEGKTWTDPAVVEDDPALGYCYTAIHFTHDAVLLAYCVCGAHGRVSGTGTVIRKIPADAIP